MRRVLLTTLVLAAGALIAMLGGTAAAAPGSSPALPPLDQALQAGPDLSFEGTSAPRTRSARAETSGQTRTKLARKLSDLASRAPSDSSFYVYDIGANKKRVLFARREGASQKLASNTKLFTTAAALDHFGSKGKLTTEVYSQGKLARKGRLKGKLYLVGAGDPAFGASGIARLAKEIKRAGIRKAKKLIADDSIFDRLRGVPDTGYGPSQYIAPLSGLTYGGSTYSGDPAIAAGEALKAKLRKRGVRVKGQVKLGETPNKVLSERPIANWDSPPIKSLIATTNKFSSNFYAEMLLKGIWARPNRKGTTDGGTRAAEQFARSQGSKISQRDGSGLTDDNRSSAKNVVELLVAMREHPDARAYFRSMTIAGKDGTLDERMEGTPAAGRCRGKTGTINGVSTLSGYCNAGHGEKVAFSFLMNGVGDFAGARSIQDRMAIEIAKFRP